MDIDEHVNATVNGNVTIRCQPPPGRPRDVEIPNFYLQLEGDDRAAAISYNGSAITDRCPRCTLSEDRRGWSLHVNHVQLGDSGNYTCTYSNGAHYEFTTRLSVKGELTASRRSTTELSMGWVDPWVRLTHGLGWIGSYEMDLWTTL